MTTDREDHWRKVYSDKRPEDVSWYQPAPEQSLLALDRFGAEPSQSLIDIGGGASTLVDALLARGWDDLTVLDIAAPALSASQARLGAASADVAWLVADITDWQPPRRYDVWHDRAVFHFLTQPEQRAAYVRALYHGLATNGLAIVATFAPEGPERCSGLEVERYEADRLAAALGSGVKLEASWRDDHMTPWGARQTFTWCLFRRTD
ncbi:MAG: methyltransferase domain-containing protein [Erythrobacter sp.]|uniref:class I SAM-dependent methyltransferase n=1 Tax=Erythrobacter sp. TaxID=1042 RepID=UPI0025D61C17|nr:methyltransferase domain-containing protein [Erythrobacter sp.]MCM0000857.1 methyltransferase domain-containing protein [Erythrobacter sp.]